MTANSRQQCLADCCQQHSLARNGNCGRASCCWTLVSSHRDVARDPMVNCWGCFRRGGSVLDSAHLRAFVPVPKNGVLHSIVRKFQGSGRQARQQVSTVRERKEKTRKEQKPRAVGRELGPREAIPVGKELGVLAIIDWGIGPVLPGCGLAPQGGTGMIWTHRGSPVNLSGAMAPVQPSEVLARVLPATTHFRRRHRKQPPWRILNLSSPSFLFLQSNADSV